MRERRFWRLRQLRFRDRDVGVGSLVIAWRLRLFVLRGCVPDRLGPRGPLLLIGALLWLIPIISLSLTLGWDHAYTQMAWFFTKAALLTFGGWWLYAGDAEQA